MRFARYFSEKSQSYYWYNDLTKEYHYEKPEEIIKKEKEFNNDINDYWIKKKKTNQNKYYWKNERTGEYSWVDPSIFSDELKPIQEKDSPKIINNSKETLSHREESMNKLIQRTKKKKQESEKKYLKESEKNEKTSDIEDLSNKVTNLTIEKKENEHSKVEPDKPKIKPKKSYSTYLDNDSGYKNYDIVNGNGIFTTIRATDKYDAMEQMRDIAQSLNPYD